MYVCMYVCIGYMYVLCENISVCVYVNIGVTYMYVRMYV